jgi:CO/xanthine dehydrogenase Mo-binding subunit
MRGDSYIEIDATEPGQTEVDTSSDLAFWDVPREPERYELHELPQCSLEVNRRDLLRLAGGGLVVALLVSAAPAGAQQPRRGRRGLGGRGGAAPQEIGAWLHIAEDGAITAYTGKVEIGQNIRTSLAQAVAEELRVPAERVRMVMADTQLVPFDSGTSGSRTTPAMASQLHKVAAAAREALLDLAAQQNKLERGSLVVKDGKVVEPASNKSFEFGHLTQGAKLTKSAGADAAATPADKWTVAGTSIAKVDGRAMVTGGHKYASDISRPGMLFGKVLRPASFKATLQSANTSAAEAMPGVILVHEGDFIGVVAPTVQKAEQALAAIRAEWTSTQQPSGAELFAHLKQRGAGGRGGFGGRQASASNDEGTADQNAAAVKLSATYTVAYIAHAPLEPRAAVAEWNDGKLTVWTGTQRPFGVRGDLAAALGVPAESIRVIVPDMGSGYGGKHTGEAAVEAARLSKATGKPVKVQWTREEEFTWAYFRPAGVIDVASAVSNDGKLTAWDFHNYNSGGSAIRSLYDVSQRSEFHQSDSPLRQGSYRALAATANHFARESHMDELAHAVKLDPLEFRLKNLKDARLRAVLEAAARQFGWGQAKPAAGQGHGIAGGSDKGSFVATCAHVAVDADTGKLKVVRLVTAFECGAVVNPNHLKNQIEGAAMMGLGGALFEGIEFADGKILNPRFSKYRVPRFADAPVLETVLVNRKDLPSAGAGETPIVTVAPAVANAIFAATGKRLRSMPMTPAGVVKG